MELFFVPFECTPICVRFLQKIFEQIEGTTSYLLGNAAFSL
jgi:hypothetical protein